MPKSNRYSVCDAHGGVEDSPVLLECGEAIGLAGAIDDGASLLVF
jgi:hypothetical protein